MWKWERWRTCPLLRNSPVLGACRRWHCCQHCQQGLGAGLSQSSHVRNAGFRCIPSQGAWQNPQLPLAATEQQAPDTWWLCHLFPVETGPQNCNVVLFSWFLPRVTIRNDHMNTFSSSSVKATIKDIFFYYSNPGLDSWFEFISGNIFFLPTSIYPFIRKWILHDSWNFFIGLCDLHRN